MRIVFLAGATGVAVVIGAAGWGLAQPVTTTRMVAASPTGFRRAAVIKLPDTQVSRTELALAKQRPTALALRSSLAQTATARVNLVAVDRATLPVLVSAKPSLTASLRVYARPTSFSAAASEPGMTVVIDGSKTATAAPSGFRLPATMVLRPQAALARSPAPPAARSTALNADRARAMVAEPRMTTRAPASPPTSPSPPAAPAPTLSDVVIERVEYGVDVSFVRFGAVYNVTIACDDPNTDPRCSEAGAKAIVAQLETIGGGAAQ